MLGWAQAGRPGMGYGGGGLFWFKGGRPLCLVCPPHIASERNDIAKKMQEGKARASMGEEWGERPRGYPAAAFQRFVSEFLCP